MFSPGVRSLCGEDTNVPMYGRVGPKAWEARRLVQPLYQWVAGLFVLVEALGHQHLAIGSEDDTRGKGGAQGTIS